MSSLDFFKNYIEDLKKSRSTSKAKVQEIRLPPALLDKKKHDRLSTEEKRSFRALISSKKHTINKQDLDKIVENANPHVLNYLSQRDDLSPVHAFKIAKHAPEMHLWGDVPYSRHNEFRRDIFNRVIEKLDQSQLMKLATDKHFHWNKYVIPKLDPSSLLSLFDPRHNIDWDIASEALKHNASSDAHLDAALQHPNPDVGYTAVHSRHFREEHLPRALTHTNPRIREAGYERALNDFGRGVPVMMSGLNDPDKKVRTAVARAIPRDEEIIRQIVPHILDNPEALEEILSRDSYWDRGGKDSYFDEDQLAHIIKTHANDERVMGQINVKKHITNPDLAELAYNAKGFRANNNSEFADLLSSPHTGPHILHDYIDKLQAPQELPRYGVARDFTKPISQILENPNVDNTHIEKILGKVDELAGVSHNYHHNNYYAHQWRSSLADIKAKVAAHPMAGAAAAQIDFDDPNVQYRLAQRGQNISDEIKAKLAESPHDKVREALIYNHTLPMPLLDKLTKDKSAKARYLAFQRVYDQYRKDDTPIPDDIIKRGLIDKSSKVRDMTFKQNINADHLNFAMNSKHAATRAGALRHSNATPEMFKKAALKDKSKEVMKAILDHGVQHLDENESAVMFARAPEDLQEYMLKHSTFKIPSNVIDRLIENGDTRAIDRLAIIKKNLSEDDIRKLYNAGTEYAKEALLKKGNVPVDLLELAVYSPNKNIVAAAARNARLPSSHIDHLIKVDDLNTKIALARRKDLKPDHFESLLASDDDRILRNVLANHNIPAHMLQNALNAEHIWNEPEMVTEALNNARATDDMFEKAMTHPSWVVQKVAKENVSLLRPDMYNKSLEGGHEIHISPLTEKLKHLKGLIEEHPDRKVHKRDLEKKGHQNLPVQILDPKGHVTPESIDSFIDATPKDRYNISYGEWKGAQRHDESVTQKVLRVNLTNEHVQKLRDMGLWETFRKIHSMSKRSGHPVDVHTLGWARIDDSHPGHWHIDEIQSDIGRGTIQAIENAARSGQMSEQDATKYKGELKTMIKVLSGQHKNINHAIFSAVHEAARQKGIKTTSMDELYDQAKQSGQSTDRNLPVHMKETYQEFPSKVGYEMKPKKEHMPNTQSKESQFQFRKLVKSLNELREMVSDFAYYELLEKSEQLVQKFESMTAGRHVQGGQAKQKTQLAPKDKVPPNRPHIRADTQTEVNLKYEKSAKKKSSERLEKQISVVRGIKENLQKAFQYKGTIFPEASDPDGMEHPAGKPYVKVTSPNHGPAWAYHPNVVNKMVDQFKEHYNRVVSHMSPRGGRLMANLGRMLAKDPDAHVIPTGMKNGEEKYRFRHMLWAMQGKPGYKIIEEPHGLTLHAERHSGRSDKPVEIHTWHFNEKGLKFLGKKPISNISGGDNEQRIRKSNRRTEENSRRVPEPSGRRDGSGRGAGLDGNAEGLEKGLKSKLAGLAVAGSMAIGAGTAKADMAPHGWFTQKYTDHALDNGMGDHLSSLYNAGLIPIVHFDSKTGNAKLGIHDQKTKRELGSFNMDGEGHFPTQKFTPEKWNAVKSSFHAVGKHFREYLRSFGKGEKSDKIPGGLADDKKPSDFNPGQIKEGISPEGLKKSWSPEDIKEYVAANYEFADADDYDWESRIIPTNKIKTPGLGGRDIGAWYKQEKKDAISTHGYDYYGELEADFKANPHNYPLIGKEGNDGEVLLDDGHHRLAMAHKNKIGSVHVIVGRKKGLKKADKIPGGLADDKKPSDFDSKQIKEGIKTELEHTKDKDIAQEIAMDHLTEDPKYYDKLKIIHKENKLAKSHPLAKSIPNGWMYVAMDGDDAGGQVERAALRDDVEAIRDISERIRQGSEMVRKFAETKLEAKTIVHGGDDLGFLIKDHYADQIEKLREIYKAVSGFSVTVGLGWTIPQATEALLYGKAHGKDQIVSWNENVGEFIKQLKSRHISPEQKIIDSGVLSKSEAVTSSKLDTLTSSKIPSVSSVAIVAGNKILMGKRNDSGRWTLPGGHSEEGETPDQTAARELFEETAIKAKDLQKLGDEEIICEDGKKRHIHSYVMVGKPKASGRLDPDGEVTKWYWIDVSKGLPKEIENNLHSKKNVTLKLLGLQEF